MLTMAVLKKNLIASVLILSLLFEGPYSQAVLRPSASGIKDSVGSIQFAKPDPQYGIRCWWWWLNGNVTKESISADLQAMKAKGFSGACIFDAGGADLRGNSQVPEGPMFGSSAWRELFLHAIKEADRLKLVMSLNIQSGWDLGAPDITPEESAKQITYSEVIISGPAKFNERLPQPVIRDNYYKDIAILAVPFKNFTGRKPVRDFEYKAAMKELGRSVPESRHLLTDISSVRGEEDAKSNQVVNLTANFRNETLTWNMPPGEWRIIRIGYTTTDAYTSTTSGKWYGHVIDYLSEKHFNRYWDTHVGPLLKLIGPMAGRTLRYLQTDSFEAGGMNWTEGFENEFKKRRGYDPVPYLPVLTEKIIGSRDVSNRFLSDFRKTLGELIAEKHYGTFAKRAKEYGIGIQPESAGPHAGPFEGLKNYGYSEVMMSEFWSPSPHRSNPAERFFVKQAASAAKIFNKRIVGAESFTTIGPHWNDVIWADMKPSVDHEFCAGLNLTYLHTFTSSPKEMGLPGQEYFAGTHFNPNVTWWDYSTPFIQYLTRCQYLLQNTTAVADVLYYYGDHVPNLGRYKQDDPAGALPGFDYDLINEDRLMALTVVNKRVVLPHGASYRVLVLPDHRIMSLGVMEKIKKLVEAGATVIGNKPSATASLTSYPQSEMQLASIANELWGEPASLRGVRKVGLGRIIWGQKAREVLLTDSLKPDFTAGPAVGSHVFDYIHRTSEATDCYFVSSQNREASKIICSFRVAGKQPELWNPVSGEIKDAELFHESSGQISIPLEFDPYGSVFIIFRKPLISRHSSPVVANYPVFKKLEQLNGPWEVRFDNRWGGPASIKFNNLLSWTNHKEEGIRYYSGKAKYIKEFDRPVGSKGGKLHLDLGEVKDIGIAQISVNGVDLGILWNPPFRVGLPDYLLKKKNNKLEIVVVNTWRNRLIGDRDKPEAERLTKTNIVTGKDWELQPSGLLGPVQFFLSDK